MPVSDELRQQLVQHHRFGPDMVDIAFRARFKCEYCSADMLASVDAYEWNWEREHVIPQSADGPDELENWAMACRVCNQIKGNWDPRLAASSRSRDDLVAAARVHIQEQRASRQTELAKVRALVSAEVEL